MKQNVPLLEARRVTLSPINSAWRLVCVWFALLVLSALPSLACAGSWSDAASMPSSYSGHTATLLPSGEVLVVGANQGVSGAVPAAAIYDPATNLWRRVSAPTIARKEHRALLLQSGKVLIVGGVVSSYNGALVSQAEIYDPASDTWSSAGQPSVARRYFSATLMPNGKVLLVGGEESSTVGTPRVSDMFDPVSGSWSVAAAPLLQRSQHAAVVLSDGRLMIAGGMTQDAAGFNLSPTTSETYSPESNQWSEVATPAPHPRSFVQRSDSAFRVRNNQILLLRSAAQGCSRFGCLYTIEPQVYDEAAGTWTLKAAQQTVASGGDTLTQFPDDKLLLVGGTVSNSFVSNVFGTASLYDPALDQWVAQPEMSVSRTAHSATLLNSGKVLVAGGTTGEGAVLGSALLFDGTTTVPGTPRNVVATPGNRKVRLSFDAPDSTGGLPILGYKVRDRTGIAGVISTTERSVTIDGLANGYPYRFIVSAFNAAGEGPRSAETPAVTPMYPKNFPAGAVLMLQDD